MVEIESLGARVELEAPGATLLKDAEEGRASEELCGILLALRELVTMSEIKAVKAQGAPKKKALMVNPKKQVDMNDPLGLEGEA